MADSSTFIPKPLEEGGAAQFFSALVPPYKRLQCSYTELLGEFQVLGAQERELQGQLKKVKQYAVSIKKKLAASAEQNNDLKDQIVQLQEKVQSQVDELSQVEQARCLLDSQLKEKQDDVDALSLTLADLQGRYDLSVTENKDLQEQKNQLEEQIQSQFEGLAQAEQARCLLENKLQDKQGELDALSSALADLQGRYDLSVTENKDLQEQKNQLEEQIQSQIEALAQAGQTRCLLESQLKDKQIALDAMSSTLVDLEGRYDLVSSALAAPVPHSDRAQAFSQLLHKDFMAFANDEGVLKNEAEVVLQLKAVEDQVRLIESLSRFKDKTVVAVAGGFSSGKSSFITSLFDDDDVALPMDIEPTTAIPTYVFHAPEHKIVGYTDKGGEVDIEPELYKQFSHQHAHKFGFNLRELLPFVALEVPLKGAGHLSFIDLPGYNPGEHVGTGQDKDTAAEFLTQAQCVIWVVGLDANGDLPKDDVDFLQESVSQDVPLYIVVNKADLRPPSASRKVMAQVKETLEGRGITFTGISVYSSEDQEEYCFHKKSLDQILNDWNKKQDSYSHLQKKVSASFQHYLNAFDADIADREQKSAIIKALELDLYELGSFETEVSSGSIDDIISKSSSRLSSSKGGVTRVLSKAMFGGNLVKTSSSSFSSQAQKSKINHRLDKVGSVQTHLGDLRNAYDTEQSNKQRETARKICDQMLHVLSGDFELSSSDKFESLECCD